MHFLAYITMHIYLYTIGKKDFDKIVYLFDEFSTTCNVLYNEISGCVRNSRKLNYNDCYC